MRKAGAALLGLLILSGCALPVPLRLASWAIDGISILTTKKSIADHGISLVAERDCAMWRSVTGQEVCVDNDAGSSTAVAEAQAPEDADGAESLASFETAAGTPASEPIVYTTPRVVVWLEEPTFVETDPAAASFQTAAGESDEPRVADWPGSVGIEEVDPAAASFSALAFERADEEVGARPAPWRDETGIVEIDPTDVVTAQPPPRSMAARVRADAGARRLVARAKSLRAMPIPGARAPRGIYFVVGSFRSLANARRMAGRHVSLAPMVVSADMDGGTIFRVMVGPFSRRERQDGRRRILQAGIFDAWAINLDTEDWRMARIMDGPARELASTVGF